MAGALPPVVAELLASNKDFMAKMAESKAAMEDVSKSGSSSFSKLSSLGGALLGGIAAGAAVVGVASVKMGADFQRSMTLLVTGAGESQKNIKMVSDGILAMAGQVGQTPQALASGMFLIESAGYHGAAGLTVLKAAAQGAAVGGAQMSTVADALTTAMHDYNVPVGRANAVTSALIQTVADGKTHLQDLASSLGKVMPTAAALGVSFQDVTGAMATMTNAGLTARLASMHLNNTLLALSAPSATATKAMSSVGLSSQQVKNALDGPGGLSSALQLIEQHVNATFPQGSVQSVNALKALMGGATGYSTALMLTGANSKTFESDVANIGKTLGGSTAQVQGFSDTQKDLSFQLDQARAYAEALATKIGLVLIPVLEDVAHDAEDVVDWFSKNKDAAYAVAAAFGAIATVAVTAFAIDKISNWISTLQGAYQWVTKLGSASATTGGEIATMGAEAATAGGEEAAMGTEAATAGGEEAAAGAAGAAGGAGAAAAGEGAVAAGAGASVGASSIVPALAAGAGSFLATSEILHHNVLGLGSAVKSVSDTVAGWFGVQTHSNGPNMSELGPASLAYLKSMKEASQAAAQAAKAGAKDNSLKNEQAILAQMRGQLAADTAKYGATSAQAHADAAALASTANKWGTSNAADLKANVAATKSSFVQLLHLTDEQTKLQTTGAGTLKESEYIKGVLDNQLTNAKTILSKDETAKASKTAIDQAKQKVADTKSSVDQVQNHITQLTNVANQITKTKDTLSEQQQLSDALGKVNTDTTAVKSLLGTGIPITKLPDSKMTGSITLKVS